jgi:tRNA(Ile)-lysidine synthase
MDFLERVSNFISEHRLLEEGQSLVVGVSGGPDSVCLLDSLVQLGYQPSPVYVDHGLRPEVDDEAEFVAQLAQYYGLKAVICQVDVPALLEEHGGSLEEHARIARYLQLLDVADDLGLDTLATAHQIDDQIETLLMHFLRGAGVGGLRGMKPSTDITGWFESSKASGKRLVRPLLAVDRPQVLAYLEERSLTYRRDPSNEDLSFRRNRVRHDLIPYLQRYNPTIRTGLERLAHIMAGQAEWVEQVVAEHWAEVVVRDEPDQLALDQIVFNQLPTALRSELMRMVLDRLQFGQVEPEYALIQSAVSFCQSEVKRMHLSGGVQIQRLGDKVVLSRTGEDLRLPQFPQMVSDAPQELPIPGEIGLAHGWRLTASLVDLPSEEPLRGYVDDDMNRAALDHESLTGDIMLRARQRGDRFRPLGMRGRMKLSNFFINQHVPSEARSLWPIVSHGDEIVWVAGLRMGEAYRLSQASTRAVVLEITPPPTIGG